MLLYKDDFLLRVWMVFTSLVSLVLSLIYLCIFSLPHASWMPPVPDWQEVAPKLLAQLHQDTDWQPEDGNFLLLISITNFVGSIGYDRSSFYLMVSPYWYTVLATTSIFSVFMALTSWMVLWYLICEYKLSLRYIPVPWIILKTMLLFIIVVVLIFLLGDMNSPTRIEMEEELGKGNYARAISIIMVVINTIFISIISALIHIDIRMVENEQVERLNRFFSLGNVSRSEDGLSEQQQLPHGNSDHVRVGL